MASELVEQLIESGIHFGHMASRWNPKMAPYIFGKRNLIHIIDVKETLKGLLLAKRFLARTVASGQDVLFVGTKRQARKAVQEQAESASMHWVTHRWLGGTLTNFHEIRKRITRLDQLEQMEADGMLDAYSKKQGASLRREMRKISRSLSGIRKMKRAPGALVIIDQKRELIAIKEANKLHIPVVCLLDTECDPDLVEIPIPGNDDAMRAIEIIMTQLCQAVTEGMGIRSKVVEKPPAAPKPRSRRNAMGTADRSVATSSPGEQQKAKPEADKDQPEHSESEGTAPVPEKPSSDEPKPPEPSQQ